MTYQSNTMSGHEACESYSVPEHVREHIDLIMPTVNFEAKLAPRSNSNSQRKRAIGMNQPGRPISLAKTNGKKAAITSGTSLANCDQQITPDCLRALYNFTFTPQAASKNSYGIGRRLLLYVAIVGFLTT